MTRVLVLSLSILIGAGACAPSKPSTVSAPPLPPPTAKTPLPQLKPPAFELTTDVKLGTVERVKLKNGIELVLVPRHEVPSVDLLVAVRAGEDAEPLGKAGLAQFTAAMLRKGTKLRTADQIADAIDTVGGDLDTRASDEEITINCRARARDIDLCLDLTSDVVVNPTFPKAEMSEVHEQLKAAIEGAKDSPQALAGQHAANLFFGDEDPRGRPLSLASLASLDRDALVAFHKRYFGPANVIITVAGDFDPKKVARALETRFGTWRARAEKPAAEPPLPSAPPRLKVRLIDKPDATQSTMVLVGPGIPHRSPDYLAVQAMNYALGAGGFSSRLMKAVRSEGGKTYGARSSFDVGRSDGLFSASTFTRNSETYATLKIVLDEIAKMKKAGPTDDELTAAKHKLIGGYGLKLETGSDVARTLLTVELHDLPRDWVTSYPARLAKVTRAEAAQAANAHLSPYVLAVVCKASEVRPLLESAGLTIDEVVKYTDPVSASERKKPTSKRTLPDGVRARTDGAAILEAAIRAKGGLALGKVRDLNARASGTIAARGTTIPIKLIERIVIGHGIYEELDMGQLQMVQAIYDGKGFLKQGGVKQPLPEPVARQMMRGLHRDTTNILAYATQPKVTITGVERDKSRGLEIVDEEGDATYVWFDSKTNQISEIIYREDGKEARDEFEDYRAVAGVQIPFIARRTVGDGSRLELKYDEIKANQGVPKELFNP